MMNRATCVLVVAIGVFVNHALPAAAQSQGPRPGFFNINFAGQRTDGSFASSAVRTIYLEEATFRTSQAFETEGLTEVSFGYRIWKGVTAGFAYSKVKDTTADATLNASIPSPIFFDRRKDSSDTLSDLAHKEQSKHLLFGWTAGFLNDKLVGSLLVGPSFVKVEQDFVLASSATVPALTQTAVFSPVTESADAKGFNVGLDVSFMVTPWVGAGVMYRYVNAHVDLDSLKNVRVGGGQFGAGIRVRF